MKYRYYLNLITIHYTSYTYVIEQRMVSLRWRYICTMYMNDLEEDRNQFFVWYFI